MSEEFPYVEVRRKGMRYLAVTREGAKKSSLSPAAYPEDEGTTYTWKVDVLKEWACQMAEVVAPGVVEKDILPARKWTQTRFDFGEKPRPLQDWRGDDMFRNAAMLLHFFFNALGFTWEDERRVAQLHLDITGGWDTI